MLKFWNFRLANATIGSTASANVTSATDCITNDNIDATNGATYQARAAREMDHKQCDSEYIDIANATAGGRSIARYKPNGDHGNEHTASPEHHHHHHHNECE